MNHDRAEYAPDKANQPRELLIERVATLEKRLAELADHVHDMNNQQDKHGALIETLASEVGR